MRDRYDVVVIGGGPAGCVTALHLLEHGIDVAIIERDEFPRYHIGESLTGECGAHLRRLGFEPSLSHNPVKRGVLVYGREAKNQFWVPVAARGSDGVIAPATTWQVRRSEFDQTMLAAARAAGGTIERGAAAGVLRDGPRLRGVRVHDRDIEARVVVDASGLSTFFCQAGVIGPKVRGSYANQTAVFSQVRNTVRDDEHVDDTLIFYAEKNHWAWFIPLDRDVVSIGVVAPADHLQGGRAAHGSLEAYLASELRTLNPELARRVPDTTFMEPVRTISNYSYRIERFVGPNYLCVGDSHRFIDPIFSFGVYFGVSEGRLAADAIAAQLAGNAGDEPFAQYQATAERGQDVISDMIDFFWERPFWFSLLVNGKEREEFLDYFAGRIYADEPIRPGLSQMRSFLREHRVA